MRTRTIALLAALIVGSLSATAAADPPGVVTMDRFGRHSKFAASLGYIGFDSDAADSATALRVDMFGEYMTPNGVGGYLVIPIGYLNGDVGFGDDSQTGLGNIELGGLYVLQGTAPVILRGGLALNTADDSDFGVFVANAYARFTDLALSIPETTWLRLSAHPSWQSVTGSTFVSGDLGIDVPIDDGPGDADLADPLIRVNLAGGIETGGVAVIGELTNTATTESDVDNRWVSALALSARFMTYNDTQPSITLQVPIDDEFEDVVDFIVIFGVEHRIHTN